MVLEGERSDWPHTVTTQRQCAGASGEREEESHGLLLLHARFCFVLIFWLSALLCGRRGVWFCDTPPGGGLRSRLSGDLHGRNRGFSSVSLI